MGKTRRIIRERRKRRMKMKVKGEAEKKKEDGNDTPKSESSGVRERSRRSLGHIRSQREPLNLKIFGLHKVTQRISEVEDLWVT